MMSQEDGKVVYRSEEGELHRVNGPAVIHLDTLAGPVEYGKGYWWCNGMWHRYYGPRDPLGSWYLHNKGIKRHPFYG
jgi:hypothetical protein